MTLILELPKHTGTLKGSYKIEHIEINGKGEVLRREIENINNLDI